MEAWIKNISLSKNYTRYGKIIPNNETKIDVEKYFGRDVLSNLKSDKNIKVIVHNAKDVAKEIKEARIKEVEAPVKIEQEKKEIEEKVKNLRKEPVKRSRNK